MSAEQLDADVKRFLELDALKANIETEQAVIKERLREGGTQTAPCGVKVTVTPNRRFNPDQAAKVIPEALLPLCQVTVIDAKKARENLPPTIYDQCATEVGSPRVSIR